VGTFHQDKGELHGITVVVDTHGEETWVGRCDTVLAEGVVLLDGAVHKEGDNDRGKQQWLERAAKFGVWKTFDRVLVPAQQVTSVRRLAEL